MSSALAAVVMVAMTVPASGPEMASDEMAQGLHLSGDWQGSWIDEDGTIFHAQTYGDDDLIGMVRIKGQLAAFEMVHLKYSDIFDEGEGKLRGKWLFSCDEYLGIYRQEGKKLLICFRSRPYIRPTSFHAGDGQHLLILHRVLPTRSPKIGR